MTKNELVKKFNDIYSNLDSLPNDESLKTAVKVIENIAYELGDIVTDIEDNGIQIEEDKSDKE